MSAIDKSYDNAQTWFDAAMERATLLDEAGVLQRQAIADAHNACNNISDPAMLADQQLYVQGRMELEEYERYLLFKYGKA
ncbi:MAG: hypothetical protein COW18_03200 [Zetaproteobacteria bacterium CG12_big_fil_rev_8_21_14_0_65_54_13]|nr:MAG: hypothetical protein COX55_08630 [Zetaproteobacteria bacterium CG23_combo_of_CG06-09_8_20_14_all_54_7]PIW50696.1 MAG: hypothetical protein COW18_03200 [Zetaproteobacteria bacterium CG12_big_fil_rev_8_21_14_0_65_54_13]PIX55577.1 MAG: hypothetical protein COZ50_01910 [Zetaproteobacteria bacterium CG_4_10_14_3_um_filter_54_28]PJA27449.1 MAG: hypothetical protein CO188_12315 [Zetaproteobacteria bacterium CG_4_9_14_3_um_filter_54_145]